VAFVVHHVAQQLADKHRVNDGGMVPTLHWLQGIPQVGRRVALARPDGHAVAEHLPARILDPVRCLDGPTGFDPAQALKQLRRLYLGNRAPADPGECVLLQPNAGPLGVARCHLGFVNGRQPVTGDVLEGAGAGAG
jgi:hypothetical protein